VVSVVLWSSETEATSERNLPSVDSDVSAESKEDERIKDERDPGGGEHEEIFKSVSFCGIVGCDPAPEPRDTVEGPLFRGRHDTRAESNDKRKEEPERYEGNIEDVIGGSFATK